MQALPQDRVLGEVVPDNGGIKIGKKKTKKHQKTTLLGLMRGGLYAGSLAAPGYDAGVTQGYGLMGLKVYAGMHPTGNKFEWRHLAYAWGPFLAVAAVDFGLSKFGVWRRAGQAMRALSF